VRKVNGFRKPLRKYRVVVTRRKATTLTNVKLQNKRYGDPFHLSANHEDGLILEIALAQALRELKIPILFLNRLNPRDYVRDSGKGVDSIFSYDGLTYGVECKNLGSYVGKSFGDEHIIKRHDKANVDKPVLVISEKRYLSENLRSKLSMLSCVILEVGFKVSWYTLHKAVHILKRKLRSLLNILPLSGDVIVDCIICDVKFGIGVMLDVYDGGFGAEKIRDKLRKHVSRRQPANIHSDFMTRYRQYDSLFGFWERHLNG